MSSLIKITEDLYVPSCLMRHILAVEDQNDNTVDIIVVKGNVSATITATGIEIGQVVKQLNDGFKTYEAAQPSGGCGC